MPGVLRRAHRGSARDAGRHRTRGIVATYDGKPINALYSSTCGGRTEDAENIFDEKVPYLVSTQLRIQASRSRCRSPTSRSIADWKDGVLAVARRLELRRRGALHGTAGPRRAAVDASRPRWRRSSGRRSIPSVLTASDLSFVTEQGLLPAGGRCRAEELLFRLIDKKGAFEWQQGVLDVVGRADRCG